MEYDLYKDNENSQIWLVDNPETEGAFLFTFDKKKIYNFFTDYPENLSKEQIEIFKKEYPLMAQLRD